MCIRDSANVVKENNQIIIKEFYPMNLLQKFSMQKESVEDWRQLVESIYIDWNYDGQTMRLSLIHIYLFQVRKYSKN